VLRFFLGELKGADLRVRSVTSIEGDELQSAPVDITRLTPAAVAAAAEASTVKPARANVTDLFINILLKNESKQCQRPRRSLSIRSQRVTQCLPL